MTKYLVTAAFIVQSFFMWRFSMRSEMLARDYENAINSNNHTLRSQTNYALPRMGPSELQSITEVAQALAWPWELIAGIEKAENGGMTLELGIKKIPADIKRNFAPHDWQRAAGARIMQQEAGKMIIQDPDVTYVFASRLAKRWEAVDKKNWRDNFVACMNHWRGEGEIVRPDKSPKQKKAGRRKRK